MDSDEQVVRRLVELSVNADEPGLLDRFVDSRVRVYPGTPGTAPATEGIDQLADAFRGFHQVFPDLHIELDQVISVPGAVAARWTATGTHRAALAGIAATGRSVRWGGIDMYRLVDGRIVEWWRNDDFLGLLQQLGHDPLAT